MFKRTWIVILGVIGTVILLSGCVGGKLAKDLTPIPTLPPGEQPALVDALQQSAQSPTEAAGGGPAMSQDQLVASGEQLFSGACSACHGEQNGAGPAFVGMADRAATRIDGMTAEDYLHQSIVDPSAYVVEGFSDIMPKKFADQFSEQEISALVAYIMAKSGGAAAPAETPAPTAEPTTPVAAPTETPVEDTPAAAEPVGNAENGATIFASSCSACHGAQDGAGPAVTGIGERAATRVAGMTAAEYLHESIVDPSAYVVEGFADIMPKTFGQQFTDQEINDLVAYLLTQ